MLIFNICAVIPSKREKHIPCNEHIKITEKFLRRLLLGAACKQIFNASAKWTLFYNSSDF